MSDLTIPFWKMEATGNDFIYLPELPDLPEIESITPELSLQNETAEQEAPKS